MEKENACWVDVNVSLDLTDPIVGRVSTPKELFNEFNTYRFSHKRLAGALIIVKILYCLALSNVFNNKHFY